MTKEEELEILKLYTIELKSINFISKKYKVGKNKVYKILGDKVRNEIRTRLKFVEKIIQEKISNIQNFLKRKMREFRIEWMKKNPERTAWRQSNLSFPEKIFLNEIKNRNLDKSFLIIREMSFHPYFIDFAFFNEKVAVEIDGSQHLIEERREKDIKKINY
jgi:very-short-patch-repair endonuclease